MVSTIHCFAFTVSNGTNVPSRVHNVPTIFTYYTVDSAHKDVVSDHSVIICSPADVTQTTVCARTLFNYVTGSLVLNSTVNEYAPQFKSLYSSIQLSTLKLVACLEVRMELSTADLRSRETGTRSLWCGDAARETDRQDLSASGTASSTHAQGLQLQRPRASLRAHRRQSQWRLYDWQWFSSGSGAARQSLRTKTRRCGVQSVWWL